MKQSSEKRSEKGIALILALIMVFVLSVMAVSLMFISQTETWSSLNYRMMSQARDGAEAGIYAGSNYIVNTYVQPGSTSSSSAFNQYQKNPFSLFPVAYAATTTSDPTTSYNTTVTPVLYNSAPVLLTADGAQSNYPISSVESAFNTNGVGYGSLTSGGTTVNYATEAKLMSMRQAFTPFGKSSTYKTTVQTWKLTSIGSVTGIRGASVQISATLEQHVYPTFNYAAFATNAGCSALQFGGGGSTDSYSSAAALVGGTPVISSNGGNVGTNGNLATNGNPTTIDGTLSTPRTGVGTCTASNVTAWTDTSGHVTGGLVELPQAVTYPTPTVPAAGTTNITTNASCPSAATMTTAGGTCTVGSGGNPACGNNTMCIAPTTAGGTVNLGDLSLTGNNDLHLAAGVYDINSLKQTGNTKLVLDSTPVILYVTGTSQTTPVDLTGGGLVNTSGGYNPMSFQVLYAGTGTIKLSGNSSAVGLLYAPNATYSFAGGSNWYGAVIGAAMTDMGGTAIHYDRQLQNQAFTVGPWTLNSFSWKKY